MNDQNMTREELLEALAKTQAQVDILQKALLEDSKLATQTQYEDIIQGFTDLVTRWLPDTTVTYVNDRYCEYFGLSMDQIVDNPFLPNLPEETQEVVKGAVRKMMSGDAESVTTEEKSYDASGNPHWIQWTYAPIRDDDGAIYQFQSVGRDITDLKNIRGELELANQVVAQSPVIIFRRKMNGYIPGEVTFISDNVSRYGITPEAIYSGEAKFESTIQPEYLEYFGQEMMKNIQAGNDEFVIEYGGQSPINPRMWLQIQVTIERDEEGVPQTMQGVMMDITDRKQADMQRDMMLERTQSMAVLSQELSMAGSLDEVLQAVSKIIPPVDLARSYLLRIDTDSADELESVRIIANWGAEGEEKLFPMGTVFPAHMHEAFKMFLSREPFLIGDMTTDERLDETTRQILIGNGMKSAVVLSLYDGRELFGGILMESRDVFDFVGDERNALGLIASQVAAVVKNELLLEATNERAKALTTVAEVATAVAEIQDPQMALKQVVNLTRDSFDFYHAHAYILEGDMLRLISGAGVIGDQMVAEGRTISYDAEQSLVAQAARTKQGVIANDVTRDPNFLPHPLLPDTKAEMAVPMMAGDEVLGVLDIQAAEAYRFTKDDVEVLTTLASQVTVALQNAQQYAELDTARDQLGEAMDLAAMAYWELDFATGNFYFDDDFYERILHITPEEAGGNYMPAEKFASTYMHPEDGPAVAEYSQKAMETDNPNFEAFAEVRYLCGDGKQRDILMRMRIEKDENGKTIKTFGTNQDITDRKQAERTLAENEERFRALVDAVPDMIFRFAPDGTIVDYKGAEGGTIVPPEVFLNKKYNEVLPPHVAAKTKEALEKGAAEAKSQTFEYELPNETGGMDIFEARMISGETGEAVALIRTVTEERKAMQALEEANAVIQQSPVIVFRRRVVDNMLDQILYVSENVKRYGYTAEDFTTGRVPFEQTVHPDDLQMVGEILVGNLQNNVDEYEFEYRGVFPGDVMTWFTLQAKIERDENGEAVLQYGTIIDITDIKEAQEEAAERAQALATVADVSTAVTSAQEDPQAVLKQMVDLTKERFGLYHAHVYQLNETGDTLELVSGAGEIGDQMVAEGRSIPLTAEQSLVARAARDKKGTIVNDVTADPDFLPHPLLPDTKAELAVPMLAGGEVIGVLDVQASGMRRFDQDDVEVLTTLASQAAVALQNAEQYAEVYRLGQIVQTSRDGLMIADLRGNIQFANQSLAEMHGFKDASEMIGKPMAIMHTEEQFRNEIVPLISGDPNEINDFVGELDHVRQDGSIFPTQMTGQVLRSNEGIPYALAAGIQDITARKQAEASREAVLAETQLQYEISQKLNTATGFENILNTVVQMVKTEKLDRAFILGLDTNEENEIEILHIDANWDGTGEGKVTPVGTQFPAEVFPVVSLFNKPELFVFNDFETDDRVDEAMKKWLLGQGLRSGILLPLLDGDRPFAAVFLESKEIDYFTKEEERAFELASGQLQAVVQNEYLLQATTKRAQELATVAEVSTAVTSAQENPQAVLKQMVDLTKDRFGLYHAHVYQMNEIGDTLMLVSGAGEIGDQMVAEGRSIPLAAEQSLVARAARDRKGTIVNDVTADPNFLPHPLLPETKAELAVPMLAGDEVLGVLDVQASGSRRFDQDDVEVLTTLASQAAVALQNAEQYESLAKAQTDLSEALDIAALAYWELDFATGNFYFDDDFYKRILHITPEEAGGNYMSAEKFASTYMHPEDGLAVAEYSQKAMETDDPDFEAFAEVRYLCGDGKQRDILMRMRIEKDENGKTIKTFGTNQDITERKQAEIALAENEERFRTLVDAVPDMIFRFAPDGTIVDYKGAEGGTIVPPEVFLNKKYDEVLPPHVAAKTKEAFEKGAAEAKSQTFEYELPNETGGMDIFEARMISGETGEAVALIRNVTEERRAVHALEDASAVIKQSPVVLFRRKVVDNIPVELLYISENISQYGFSPEAFMNGQTNFEETVHPDDVQRLGKEMFGSISRGEDTFETEYRAVIAGGSVVWFRFQATIERDENGVAVIQQGILSDITDSKTSFEEMQLLYEASTNLNSAAGMEEILVAVMNAVSTRRMDRGFIFQVNTDDEHKVQNARILANWDAVDASKLLPVGTVLTPANFELVRTLWDDPEPMLVDDIATDERIDEKTRAFLLRQNMKSIITLPLLDGETPLAFVLLESPDQYNFTDRDKRLADLATIQLTSVIQSELLHETTARRADELALVAEVSTAVTAAQEDPQAVLKQMVDLTKERFGLYHAHVYQLNEAGDTLNLVSGAGEIGDQMVAEGRSIPLTAEQSLVARAARNKKGTIVNDVTADPNFLPHPLLPDTKAELAVPMLAGDEVLGVLDVQASGMRRFDHNDVEVLTTLASQAAVALQNAEQYAELQRADEVVQQSPVILFRRRIVDNMLEQILYVSSSVNRYGYIPEQFVSGEVPFEQTVHPDHLQRVGEILIGNLQNNVDEYTFEYQGMFPDGNMPWFQLQASIERDENGEAVLQVGTIIDITETKKAQLEVAENEERFRTLVDAVPDLIFRFAPDGTIVDYKGAEGGTYVPPEVFLNKKYDEVLPPHVAALTKEAFEKAAGGEKTQTFQYQLPGDEGGIEIFEARIILNETGEAVGLIRDVTERERLLAETRSRAEQEAMINAISQKIQATTSVEDALQVAIRELGDSLGANKTSIRLGVDAAQRKLKK